jgi:hypothetical protein
MDRISLLSANTEVCGSILNMQASYFQLLNDFMSRLP